MKELPFEPFPLLKGSHQQTIAGTMISVKRFPKSRTEYIQLPDNDRIAIEVSTSENWNRRGKTVIMIHGMGGSHKSNYLVRMTFKLMEENIRAIRINMRGSGSGRGHAKQCYHGGRSEDIFEVLKVLKIKEPHSDFYLIGFSLGGNIAIKLAGELGRAGSKYLSGVIAVNSPLDLKACADLFSKPDNKVYERYFSKLRKDELNFRQRKFPSLPRVQLPRLMSVIDYDEIYTAPLYGYKSAQEYYQKSSAIRLLNRVKIPARLLFAEDDPIIASSHFIREKYPSNIEMYMTKQGGHMGYLGSLRGERGFYWMDNLLMEWIHSF